MGRPLDGTIDLIGSDHAPHTLERKAVPFMKAPSGMPLVELSLPLLLNSVNQGRISIEQVAHWFSYRPANLFDIEKKGV